MRSVANTWSESLILDPPTYCGNQKCWKICGYISIPWFDKKPYRTVIHWDYSNPANITDTIIGHRQVKQIPPSQSSGIWDSSTRPGFKIIHFRKRRSKIRKPYFFFQREKFVRSRTRVNILNRKRMSGWKHVCRSCPLITDRHIPSFFVPFWMMQMGDTIFRAGVEHRNIWTVK